MLYSRYNTLQARIYRRNTGRFPKRAPEGPGACFPGKFFWISTSWVSETFRQTGHRMLASFILPRMKPYKSAIIIIISYPRKLEKILSKPFSRKKKFENLTDFRKTVETKLDPRLPFFGGLSFSQQPVHNSRIQSFNNPIPRFQYRLQKFSYANRVPHFVFLQ